jgi:hypothetical protein
MRRDARSAPTRVSGPFTARRSRWSRSQPTSQRLRASHDERGSDLLNHRRHLRHGVAEPDHDVDPGRRPDPFAREPTQIVADRGFEAEHPLPRLGRAEPARAPRWGVSGERSDVDQDERRRPRRDVGARLPNHRLVRGDPLDEHHDETILFRHDDFLPPPKRQWRRHLDEARAPLRDSRRAVRLVSRSASEVPGFCAAEPGAPKLLSALGNQQGQRIGIRPRVSRSLHASWAPAHGLASRLGR